MFTRAQSADVEESDSNSHEPKGRMSHRRCHFSHLPVSSLSQRNLNPRGGNALAIPDGHGARRNVGFPAHELDLRRKGLPVFDHDPIRQPRQRVWGRRSLELGKICAGMLEFRIEQEMLEPTVIREQDEAFAVCVEPPRRVDVLREGPIPRKSLSAAAVRELAQSAVRFIEKDILKEFQKTVRHTIAKIEKLLNIPNWSSLSSVELPSIRSC